MYFGRRHPVRCAVFRRGISGRRLRPGPCCDFPISCAGLSQNHLCDTVRACTKRTNWFRAARMWILGFGTCSPVLRRSIRVTHFGGFRSRCPIHCTIGTVFLVDVLLLVSPLTRRSRGRERCPRRVGVRGTMLNCFVVLTAWDPNIPRWSGMSPVRGSSKIFCARWWAVFPFHDG